jgi:hypothetical protein
MLWQRAGGALEALVEPGEARRVFSATVEFVING